MALRKIPDESDPELRKYNRSDLVKRRMILKETLEMLSSVNPSDKYYVLAKNNLEWWQKKAKHKKGIRKVQILQGDWGDVTYQLTKQQ